MKKKPTKKNYAFVDNANVTVSVSRQGRHIDWGKLKGRLQRRRNVSKVFMMMGYHPDYESMYEYFRSLGYELVFKPMNIGENIDLKGNVDTDLVLRVMKERRNYDKAIICSGDGDFLSLVKHLKSKKKLGQIIVPHSGRYSHFLDEAAGEYITSLTGKRRWLEYKKESKKKKEVRNMKKEQGNQKPESKSKNEKLRAKSEEKSKKVQKQKNSRKKKKEEKLKKLNTRQKSQKLQESSKKREESTPKHDGGKPSRIKTQSIHGNQRNATSQTPKKSQPTTTTKRKATKNVQSSNVKSSSNKNTNSKSQKKVSSQEKPSSPTSQSRSKKKSQASTSQRKASSRRTSPKQKTTVDPSHHTRFFD